MENVPLHSRSLLEALNTLELDVLKNVANLNKPNPDFTLTDIENIRAHVRSQQQKAKLIISQLAESLEDSELSDDQIKDISGKYKDRWEEAVKKFRSANLNIQKWWETQLLTRKRTELLNNASIQKPKYETDALKAAQNATSVIQRMTQLMATEVQRSVESAQVLEESSRLMKETTNNYENIGGVLNTTKFLLNKLKQRDYTDRALIGFAFTVYILVVFYIVQKRVWIPDLIRWIWNWMWSLFWQIASLFSFDNYPIAQTAQTIDVEL